MSDLLNAFGATARRRGPVKGSTNKRTDENIAKMDALAEGGKVIGNKVAFAVTTDNFGATVTTLRKVVKLYAEANGFDFESADIGGSAGYILSKDAPKAKRTRTTRK